MILVVIVIGLIIANVVVFIKKQKFTNEYNYTFTATADKGRCNCQGAQTVPTWGGNLQMMAQSPLNIGVGV